MTDEQLKRYFRWAVFAFVLMFVFWHGNEKIAAWVQAAGAAAAVWAAFSVSNNQRENDLRRERERDHAERLRILEGPIGIMGAVLRHIEEVPTSSSDESEVEGVVGNEAWWGGFMRAQQALRAIPLHEIPWWDISERILEMLEFGDRCQSAMNKLNHEFAQRRHTVPEDVWRNTLSVLERCVHGARATMEMAQFEAERIRSDRS